MNLRPIQGDPLLADGRFTVSLDWYDRVTDDQLRPYTDHSPENERCNADCGWEEHLERISEPAGKTDLDVRWWEYRGRSVSGPAPLVVCFYEYYNTTWQRIADREGLVIIAFEYHRNQRRPTLGLGTLGYGPWDDEMEAYHTVIERTIEKYGCDRGRVYMNGLSYGDMTTLIYAKRYGETLAGAVCINGPSCAYNLERYGLTDGMPALPSMQIRSDDDITCDGFLPGLTFEQAGNEEWLRNLRSREVVLNRNVWMRANGADAHRARILTRGSRAFVIYDTGKYDVIFAEFNRKCHIIPVDNAEVMWEMLFSRYRRGENGEIERIAPPLAADEGCIAFSVGCDHAYVNNERADLGAACLMLVPRPDPPRDSVVYCNTECSYPSLYVPARALKACFGLDYTVVYSSVTRSEFFYGKGSPDIELRDGVIRFEREGESYALYINTCVVERDGKICDLERPPLIVRGELMLPVKELAELFGLFCCVRNGAAYVSARPFEMGYTLPRLLREELLPDEVYVPEFTVEVRQSENGSIAVSAETLPDGGTLRITAAPDEGYRLARVVAAVNGVPAPIYETGENEYTAFNIMGDVCACADFERV